MTHPYPKRFAIVLLGLLICGLGNYFLFRASNVGVSGWVTLQDGISLRSGLSYGTCTVLVSFGLIAVDFLLRGKIGFGTILNAIIVGKTVDLIAVYADFLPEPESLLQGLIYLVAGQAILSLGMVIYMKPGLGCGPRDTLMVVLGQRFPKANIGFVRFFIDMSALLVGILLGGPYGWGTVFSITCNSYILQAVFRLCRFESRDVEHEDVLDTLRNLFGREQAGSE